MSSRVRIRWLEMKSRRSNLVKYENKCFRFTSSAPAPHEGVLPVLPERTSWKVLDSDVFNRDKSCFPVEYYLDFTNIALYWDVLTDQNSVWGKWDRNREVSDTVYGAKFVWQFSSCFLFSFETADDPWNIRAVTCNCKFLNQWRHGQTIKRGIKPVYYTCTNLFKSLLSLTLVRIWLLDRNNIGIVFKNGKKVVV